MSACKTTLLMLIAAATLSACAAGNSTTAGHGLEADDVSIADMWSSVTADVLAGRSHSAESRARELADIQARRCQELRTELLLDDDSSSAIDTGNLARCEEELRQYRILARMSPRRIH